MNNPVLPAFPKVETIEFRHVSASYSESASSSLVLKDISITIKGNQRIGVIGKSGSGKSTFVKLLWRYVQEQSGQILFNNKNIDQIELRSLRKSLCVLSQESHIMIGSLRLNVDPNSLYSDQMILMTLKDVGFENPGFQKNGLDFELSEDGKNISVGERQLICLARVMLSKASIIILDEATASIDHKVNLKVKEKIEQRFGRNSIIINVAHRIDTILNSDRIIAFADGKIIEDGTPQELLSRPQSYLKRMMGEESSGPNQEPKDS